MTLTEFLLARIEEDEAEASWVRHENRETVAAQFYGDLNAAWIHSRNIQTLAECEAKRRIVEKYDHARDYGQGPGGWLEQCVGYLAGVYADHPDFDEAWRP